MASVMGTCSLMPSLHSQLFFRFTTGMQEKLGMRLEYIHGLCKSMYYVPMYIVIYYNVYYNNYYVTLLRNTKCYNIIALRPHAGTMQGHVPTQGPGVPQHIPQVP